MTNVSKPSSTSDGTVRQTIITNLEAPRLEGVATKYFTAFLKKRDLYEKQLAEKNREPGVHITPTSYRASIDDSYLRIFLTAKWIKAESLEAISEEQIRECVKEKASYKLEEYELDRIDNLVKDVKMDMSLKEAEDRVWSLHLRYLEVLEAAGLADLPTRKPHIAIKHILKRIKPFRLRSRIRSILQWRKGEDFGKKDFGAFMRVLAEQAKTLEMEQVSREQQMASSSDSDRSSEESSGKHDKRHRVTKKGKKSRRGRRGDAKRGVSSGQDKHPKDSLSSTESKKRRSFAPKCFNPACDGYHFIDDCPISSEEQRRRYKDEYRARKQRKMRFDTGSGSADRQIGQRKGSVRRIGADAIDPHSSLFSATFIDSAVESVIMADQGSDGNIMPPAVFDMIAEAASNLHVASLVPPHTYSFVDQDRGLTCRRSMTADVHLRIRHGVKLVLRNITWKVSDQPAECVIIGREVLQAIGCDNKAMLQARATSTMAS
ncbi:unnamed protein product [Chondrus crispus]|uniref:Uncharacterized protein n=1 Tax=Chondrus crispus TaxID=2769 RepID=R7Q5R6_CHOCR|nr:unnamed protein product [Chondrus crispus]CDF33359.1 unnamed protein product [Chondrus crispus]|eukprot:XP_005713162.1 unnamed protein product [Chondrus crispus]